MACLPLLARPILKRAVAGFHGGNVLALALAGLVVALLLMLPLVVLGALGPVLVQRGVDEHGKAGAVAGRFGACGTLGSLLGTFIPGLVLVPLVGTDRCFALCGALLAAAGLLGLRKRRVVIAAILVAFVLSGAAVDGWRRSARGDGSTLYEAESRWGYIRVTEKDGLRRTQVIASTTLLFPQPLGPTMAVTPWSKASSDRSGKLLKPAISRRLRRIFDSRPGYHDSRCRRWTDHDPEAAGNASNEEVFGIRRLDNGR